MSEKVTPFSKLNLESTLVSRLEEINKKYAIGPQKSLIEAMIKMDNDIILKAGKETGKSTGYLIPMVNEAIKRDLKNDTRKCVGLIITWSSEMVKNITELANELCLRFPITIISGQKRSLCVEVENGYFIVITKAVLLFNNLFTMEQLFKGLNYIVIEQASCFASKDKSRTLLEILKRVRSKGTSNITTILSCIDFKGTQNQLRALFLEKEPTFISSNEPNKAHQVDREPNEDYNLSIELRVKVYRKVREFKLEAFCVNNININVLLQKVIFQVLRKKTRNIVIYFKTNVAFSIMTYQFNALGIPFKISNGNFDENNNNLFQDFGNVLICFDDVEEKLIDVLKRKVVIHYFLPLSKEVFNKRIEINKKSGEYLKSIVLDNRKRLDNFFEEGNIMS